MKMWKIPKVASDAIVAGEFFYVDITTLQDMTLNADNLVVGGNGWTLTFTFDGTNAAEKLANTQAMAAYLAPKMLEHTPVGLHRIEQQKIFKLWDGFTIATIHTETGIVRTGDANTALISIGIS